LGWSSLDALPEPLAPYLAQALTAVRAGRILTTSRF
jgi:hypothetical protein